ncbi:toxin ParE1/3/4 [Sphingomonas jinjuensis]|uniref:Toxin ParE1/3/4 n=1 Tax=Sphingomonas jinjuensis TaxID=535907 RepID=A0A840F9V9_9SPHN|nr:toxin ParE1/3/4 [Sphingomonas jinjuensis]
MPDVRLSTAAEQDLRDIRNFSKQRFGVAVTRTYLLGLRSIVAGLRSRPQAGIAEDDLAAGLRSIGYRSHRVYFLPGTTETLVVRILLHAQDKSRLTDV